MKNFKLKIKKAGLLAILHFAFCIFNCSAITPFFIKTVTGTNSAGAQQIGVALLTPSTALDSPFTVNGTNLVFGGNSISNFTFTLDSTGYSSNALYAGTYKFIFTNWNAAFIAAIPDTTNFLSLTTYITNLQVFPGLATSSYQNLTNLLGLAPATNSYTGIVSALGYTPPASNAPSVIGALGFQPASNSYTGIIAPLGYTPPASNGASIIGALNFQPASNSYAGIITPLGYTPPASNAPSVIGALGFQPASNSYTGIITPLGYTPPASNNASITGALGYTAKTNDGYIGIVSPQWSITTNGFLIWVAYKTNGVPGSAFTNLPTGSIMTTTNGGIYYLSNIVWNPLL